MADEERMGWLGEVPEATAEVDVPPEQFLRRLREAAPPVASQGGPWLSFEPFRSEVNGHAFTVRQTSGRGEWPRLEGTAEAAAKGCLVRYAMRPPWLVLPMLVVASLFALLIPLGLMATEGPGALIFYAALVPAVGLVWYLAPLFQRMSARRTLAFFRGLLAGKRREG